MDDVKFAAVYVRVSTEKQDVENQLRDLLPYCERKGYSVYNQYVDVVSGTKDSRPAFTRMFRDAHQLKFDLVLFWSLDRFSRAGTLYTLTKMRELENLGVGWESYSEPVFSSVGEFKDVVLSIMATLAKMERDKISERTKAGLARAKAQGKFPGRPKGSKDSKKRRTKGYYDNRNYAGIKQRGVDKPPQNYVHPHRVSDSNIVNKRAFFGGERATLITDLSSYNKMAVLGAEVEVKPDISRLGDRFAVVVFSDLSILDVLKHELKFKNSEGSND